MLPFWWISFSWVNEAGTCLRFTSGILTALRGGSAGDSNSHSHCSHKDRDSGEVRGITESDCHWPQNKRQTLTCLHACWVYCGEMRKGQEMKWKLGKVKRVDLERLVYYTRKWKSKEPLNSSLLSTEQYSIVWMCLCWVIHLLKNILITTNQGSVMNKTALNIYVQLISYYVSIYFWIKTGFALGRFLMSADKWIAVTAHIFMGLRCVCKGQWQPM